MLLFSLFQRISNIADLTNFGVNPIQEIVREHSFMRKNTAKAYLIEPKHIKACVRQSVNNYSLKIAYKINHWQQQKKLNSGENTDLITFLK